MSPLMAGEKKKKKKKLAVLLMRRGPRDSAISSAHNNTNYTEKPFSQRLVIKINGAHKFASAERVVFNEIL